MILSKDEAKRMRNTKRFGKSENERRVFNALPVRERD